VKQVLVHFSRLLLLHPMPRGRDRGQDSDPGLWALGAAGEGGRSEPAPASVSFGGMAGGAKQEFGGLNLLKEKNV
jgi:hypothetical protein